MSGSPPDILKQVALDAAAIPAMQDLTKLRELARELSQNDRRIASLKKELEVLEERSKDLSTKLLPQAFESVFLDKIGVPEEDVDVVVVPHYFANIKADWPEETREAGFKHLAELGGESLVKVDVTVSFGRKEWQLAKDFVEFVRTWNRLGERDVTISKGVQWNTLTSFVQKEVEKRSDPNADPGLPKINLGALGAFVGRACRVKPRTKVKRT